MLRFTYLDFIIRYDEIYVISKSPYLEIIKKQVHFTVRLNLKLMVFVYPGQKQNFILWGHRHLLHGNNIIGVLASSNCFYIRTKCRFSSFLKVFMD